eukprot:11199176-Ditylum_brightwellii.AAC.1
MDGCETQYNLYTTNCTGEVAVIYCANKKQGGIQFKDCMQYWTANSSALTKMTKKCNKHIVHAKQCVVKLGLTADNVKGLKKM